MNGVTYTLLIGRAPASASIVDAVQEIEVDTSTEVASVLRLRLGVAQTAIGDWEILQDDLLRPLVPLGIRVQVGAGVPKALVNGYVASQRVVYGDEPGTSALEVTAMDATLLMNLEEKITAWPNMADSVIATSIFGQHTLAPKVESTSPGLVEQEGTTIQRGTDIRFLRHLARRNGFECFVQAEPITGIDQGFFRPPPLAGAPQAVLSVSMGLETNVSQFGVRYDMVQPTTVDAAGLDIKTKSTETAVAAAAAQTPLGREGALLRLTPAPVIRPADTGEMRNPGLKTLAQALVDRSEWAVVAEGQVGSDVGVLRPGELVNVRGAGSLFNGSYYVTRVVHRIGPGGYTQRFEARRNAVGMTGAELYVAV